MKTRLILAALGAALALGGCADDDFEGLAQPTLRNIWPHADGSEWTFTLKLAYADVPADPDMSRLPSMETLRERLLAPPTATTRGDTSLVYIMALDGEVTTEAGVTAQHLTERFEPLAPTKAGASRVPESGERRLLRLLAAVRPDLGAAVAARLGKSAADGFQQVGWIGAPTFTGGYAFAAESDGYYGYGDLYPEHSWVYLAGSPVAGREFSLQLVRGLADDVWLHGRIWSVTSRRLPGLGARRVVECMYVLDLGEQTGVDESGEALDTYRSYIYGIVWYVPEVGPVGGVEQSQLMVRTAYNPEGTGEYLTWLTDYRLDDHVLPDPEPPTED